jgi:hypothetical protein
MIETYNLVQPYLLLYSMTNKNFKGIDGRNSELASFSRLQRSPALCGGAKVATLIMYISGAFYHTLYSCMVFYHTLYICMVFLSSGL